MLRTTPLLPLTGLSTLGFDTRRFHPTPPVCLPGLLTATRTGLTPASNSELTNTKMGRYVTASPPVLLGAQLNGIGLEVRCALPLATVLAA